MKSELNHSIIRLLKTEIADIHDNDIINLINNLVELSDQKNICDTQKTDRSDTLDQWMPNRQTIKEIIKSKIKITDLQHCIEDFRQFAKLRQWQVTDNLDAKFIGHIKIMITKSKVTPE